MSNTLRYDSLLVRHLRDELAQTIVRHRLTTLHLNRNDRVVSLGFEGFALRWELHPERGWLLRGPAALRQPDGTGGLKLPRQATVRGVEAPPDERLLRLSFGGSGTGRVRSLVVELMTNQWNAFALDGEDRIVGALWPREAGDRVLRAGRRYEAPAQAGGPRLGAAAPPGWGEWSALLGPMEPGERRRALVRGVAYTGPLNATPILGAAGRDGSERALREAYDRYRELVTAPSAPCVLEGAQPYPVRLAGIEATPAGSLLAAMEAVAGDASAAAARSALPEADRERLLAHRDRLGRRVRRMRSELEESGPESAALRRQADLLLSQLYRVEKGAKEIELDDLEGGTLVLALDPRLPPAANATRLYDEAARRERAAARLPGLIREAEAERDRVADLVAAADRGEAVMEEVTALLDSLVPASTGPEDESPTLPYRRYRTSGGLEVRVGRGRRANDDLTFHHSAPDDVWLHARSVAGAHVILRWDRDDNPPRRDLLEAAILAALSSKARTSGTVAVDWTRRKYVRKPRKAAPGLVVPDRVKTIFVEPDPRLPDRLADAS